MNKSVKSSISSLMMVTLLDIYDSVESDQISEVRRNTSNIIGDNSRNVIIDDMDFMTEYEFPFVKVLLNVENRQKKN